MLESFFGVNVGIAALLLRLATGTLFAIHGYPKLGAQRKGASEWMNSMGLPSGLATFGGVVEFFGGIALLFGIFTPIVAGLFAPYMLSTTWLAKTKMKKKYAGGYELDITLAIASLALAAIGSGSFSVDHLLGL